jgi:hypothetical protein
MAGLNWKSGNMTVYQSYPPPNSPECIQFNGCMYEGQFAYCPGQTKSAAWVQSHNVVSFFDGQNGSMADHRICIKYGNQSIVGVVLDTCSDSDCCGCCTQNQGAAAALIDVELGLDSRFLNVGINGGQNGIQWADLGADPNACN